MRSRPGGQLSTKKEVRKARVTQQHKRSGSGPGAAPEAALEPLLSPHKASTTSPSRPYVSQAHQNVH